MPVGFTVWYWLVDMGETDRRASAAVMNYRVLHARSVRVNWPDIGLFLVGQLAQIGAEPCLAAAH